jgi:lipopolysaccharide transport system ATP-binding protein
MSSDIAIRVEDLSKAYMIKHQQNDHVTLAQVALERVRHPLRRSEREQFWAMQDVAFEVNAGEVLGVIGRNGAGKSTLLKLLTRITAPTTGEIDIWGRVGSLLEVGTGFHPELTGRENIYLNGSIIGMKREEIDRQFEAIVDFAGVEKFLDTPVKRYSSGMYVRLAFAVAAHLETEILLIDEVLAVGDQEFQRKCLDKMHQSAVDGRTVLFVSHQLESITTLCNRVLRLDSGRVHSIGETSEIISGYIKDQTRMEVRAPSRVQSGSTWQLGAVELEDPSLLIGQPIAMTIYATRLGEESATLFPSIEVRSIETGDLLAHCDGRRVGAEIDTRGLSECSWRFEFRTPWLRDGNYEINIWLCTPGGVVDSLEPGVIFSVLPECISPEVVINEWIDATLAVPDFSMIDGRRRSTDR